eukprot:COSAG02_NODE_5529_length_4252_cov_7.756080_3_plen_185_part_00
MNGQVHSPYKQPVGARLARAALAQAYNEGGVQSAVCATVLRPLATGNIAVTISLSNTAAGCNVDDDNASIISASGKVQVEVRTTVGFEVLGSDGLWHSTPIVKRAHATMGNRSSNHNSNDAGGTLMLSGSPKGARAIRYLWYEAPCTQQPYRCAVYVAVSPLGSESGEMEWLPLGPFFHSFENA